MPPAWRDPQEVQKSSLSNGRPPLSLKAGKADSKTACNTVSSVPCSLKTGMTTGSTQGFCERACMSRILIPWASAGRQNYNQAHCYGIVTKLLLVANRVIERKPAIQFSARPSWCDSNFKNHKKTRNEIIPIQARMHRVICGFVHNYKSSHRSSKR